MKTIVGADLFCGAGGTSTGLLSACGRLDLECDLLAVNHWPRAIRSHRLNHPHVRHLCERLDRIRPEEVIPGGKLDILCASPECTHHSIAKGGKPRSDQSRSTAWAVADWVSKLWVENLLIENVPEFQNWGPLAKNGKPDRRRSGQTFNAFISALEATGLRIEFRVLNSADFGDATCRRRLFILGRRKPITWPVPTHAATRRPCREIIDWNLPGQSLTNRRRQLSPNTMRRIAAGMPLGEPFLVKYYSSATRCIPVSEPMDTITTRDRFGLVIPELDGDVRFRMLQPKELAAAMSFPNGYKLDGPRADQVRQIGNAVPVRTAAALCEELLR